LLFDIPVAGSQTAFFLLAKFRQKAKSKIAVILQVLVARSGEGKNSRNCKIFIFCC
jgi:hypothetical protein